MIGGPPGRVREDRSRSMFFRVEDDNTRADSCAIIHPGPLLKARECLGFWHHGAVENRVSVFLV